MRPLRDHPIINPRNKDQRQFPINLGCIPGDRDAFLEKVLNHENVPLPVDVSQKEEGEIIIKIKR